MRPRLITTSSIMAVLTALTAAREATRLQDWEDATAGLWEGISSGFFKAVDIGSAGLDYVVDHAPGWYNEAVELGSAGLDQVVDYGSAGLDMTKPVFESAISSGQQKFDEYFSTEGGDESQENEENEECTACKDKQLKQLTMCSKLCPEEYEFGSNTNESCEFCMEQYTNMVKECVKACDVESYMRDYCKSLAGAGAAIGAFIPSAFYSAVGLGASGPVAGGLFAGAQGAGVAAGSWMASLQAAAMTGPLLPVVGSAAALGGTGYYACKDYLVD